MRSVVLNGAVVPPSSSLLNSINPFQGLRDLPDIELVTSYHDIINLT
jgi:hypothetical protein